MRSRLTDWFEAKDIKDPEERLVIREVRQGKESSESSLLDLAISAETRGDMVSADSLYHQALLRNPKSWKAAWKYAEFMRHIQNKTADAIRLYEQAAANAPLRGTERARYLESGGCY